jgi:acetoacetyl-CoA synthetase
VRAAIVSAVRTQLSPRHVPDRIVEAPGIPTTLNGKRMEVPVKRLLMGERLVAVANVDAVSDPETLRWFAAFAADDAIERSSSN